MTICLLPAVVAGLTVLSRKSIAQLTEGLLVVIAGLIITPVIPDLIRDLNGLRVKPAMTARKSGMTGTIVKSAMAKVKPIYLICLLPVFLFSAPVYSQTNTAWLDLSFRYLEEQKPDSAEIALKNQLSQWPADPVNPFLLNNLGTIQRSLGKKEEALMSYTAALGSHPGNKIFLHARASLFVEINQPENALLDYSTLLQNHPTDEEALYQRGLLYLQVRQVEAAEADFRKLLDLYPDGLYPRMSFASLAKFKGEYEEAEKIYNYLLDKEPERAELYAGRAELYVLMNKGGKASTDATRAIRLSADNPNPYYYIIRYRAKCLLLEKESAEADYRKAVELGYGEN